MSAFGSAFSKGLPACESIEGGPAAPIQKPFDVIECIRFCLKKWLIIAAAAVLCAVIAGAAYLVMPPVYESTAKLYILAPDGDGIQTSDLQAGSMLLLDYREVFKTWEFHELVQQQTQNTLSYQQLQGMLRVETPDDTRLVYITIRHPDAAMACELANACAQAARLFIEENLHGLQPSSFSTAIIPGSPSGWGAPLWIALAFAAGATMAAGICVVVFCLDDVIRTENELKMASGLAVLADEKDNRSLLLASRLINQKIQCVLLTGAEQGAVSQNLRTALAAFHRKTVLIRTERSVGACNGIADYLEGLCEAEGLLQTVGPNAALLRICASSEELPVQLYHPRMEQLMDTLKKQFDVILIDAAPLDQYADASAFFPFCDGAVLTAVREKSRMKTLAAQSAILTESSCRALGAVFVRSGHKHSARTHLRQGAAL